MKTFIAFAFAFMLSSVGLTAKPLSINVYSLPSDWPASEFFHTVGSPRSSTYSAYSLAAILNQNQVEKFGISMRSTDKSSIEMENGATLTVVSDPSYKSKAQDDTRIKFTIQGPDDHRMESSINITRGWGVVLKYLTEKDSPKPRWLLFQLNEG